MIDKDPSLTTPSEDQPAALAPGDDFTLPLDATTRGRLVFATSVANVRLDAHPNRAALYAAHFERHIPSVWVQDGIITIQYRRHSPLDWLIPLAEPRARVALNSTIPWEIEFRGGVSRLMADLSRLQVRALDLSSVSTARLTLPVPAGPANIYFSGSASDITLHRPAGVAIRLQIAGSASQLTLDRTRMGAISGGVQWQSPDYYHATNRYEVGIAGSVSSLTIDTR